MANILQIVESPQDQTSVESITYILDVANGPGTTDPSSVAVTAVNIATSCDQTTTVFPTNSPSVSGTSITLSPLLNLTAGETYHIRVQYTSHSDILQPYAIIHCPY